MFGMIIMSALAVVAALVLLVVLKSLHQIGPTEVGLVLKRWGAKIPDENPVAFNGEAGYQADLLMPGLRFKLWPVFAVSKHLWVQVPAGEIGVVIAQVGKPTPTGAKSAEYKPEFGIFTDIRAFVSGGGQKGVQRPVLQPGTLAPVHPIGFFVITKGGVFGESVGAETKELCEQIDRRDLRVTVIPEDVCGVVTVREGPPIEEAGAIASRLGGFDEISQLEATPGTPDAALIESLLANRSKGHNNYQDFQAFLALGGRNGLQHDTLVAGAYALNPFLVRIQTAPMLVVEQGEVAVIKAYIGLPTSDTSGPQFQHGSLVRPGHRGLWQEPLRTGKYPLNPVIYTPIKVPTAILSLNWAEYSSTAHNLDKDLKPIGAKSREGFGFSIDLQVQLHVPDTKAPRVISRVGSIQNLVNELLQGAIGNHFRNKLQGMTAVQFIEERETVQAEAQAHVTELLGSYEVQTIGCFIQDVKLPEELTRVLKEREIARQEIETYGQKKAAENARQSMEEAKGLADIQTGLVKARIGVDIERHNADSRKAKADGEAYYLTQTGKAKAVEVEAEGLARAAAYEAQVKAMGQENTARINIARELANAKVPIVPQIATGGTGGMAESLLALTASQHLSPQYTQTEAPAASAPAAGTKENA